MRALLVAIGSHGDVHPFMGIGLRLRERGHHVTVMANGHFEGLVRRAGFEFVEVGTAAHYEALAKTAELWDPRKGFKLIMENVGLGLRPVYEAIRDRYVPGETVVAHSTLGLGARIAEDKLGVPTVTVHLQPANLRTLHETPRLPGSPMRAWQPRWVKAGIWWVADTLIIDPALAGAINSFRAELGLGPVKRIMKEWWNSPRRVACLYPEWFAPPQPDWPGQVRMTGFPLYDEKGIEPLPAELEDFLGAGEKAIAFTPGSAMWQGRAWFDAAVGTCKLLGRRGILLSRRAEHIPPGLPKGVIHAPFAPFSELLPRCAALVHHGGIGTLSQGLAAGIPQLVIAMAHDQPDNGERLEKLGVGRWVWVKQFDAARAGTILGELLGSAEVARACAEIKAKVRGKDALGETCNVIEELAGMGGHGGV